MAQAPKAVNRTPQRICVLCDGTWQERQSVQASTEGGTRTSSEGPYYTNVSLLARAIPNLAQCPSGEGQIRQVVFYQKGIGTTLDELANLFEGATGSSLASKVEEAYTFIADNYVDGDELFLFGFSRGAYTARCIAGFLNWAGVLHKRELDGFQEIWTAYQQRCPTDPNANVKAGEVLYKWTKKWPGLSASATATLGSSGPLEASSTPQLSAFDPNAERIATAPIKVVGVWDTVGALGIPGSFQTTTTSLYSFYDPGLGENVEHAFHALALAEDRQDFLPTKFYQNPPREDQQLKQCWFQGSHTDCGGGYAKHGLSDITLGWMGSQLMDQPGGPLLTIDLDCIRDIQDRRQAWAMEKEHPSRLAVELQKTRSVCERLSSDVDLENVMWKSMVQNGRTNESIHHSVWLSQRYSPDSSQFSWLKKNDPKRLDDLWSRAKDISSLGPTELALKWGDAQPDNKPPSMRFGDDFELTSQKQAPGIVGTVFTLMSSIARSPTQLLATLVNGQPTSQKNLKPGLLHSAFEKVSHLIFGKPANPQR